MASTARRVVSTVPSSFVLRRRRGKEISFRYSGMICCMTVAVVSRLPFEEQNFAVRHVVLSSLSKASARGRRGLCPGKRKVGGHKCNSGVHGKLSEGPLMPF